MSEIVAIITEYNPFHNGHKYQIDKIREEMPNATIIAIMSGNTVQRGNFAFCNKYARAKMAIECGVDAVFELPFPYSCSTAEIFANAGVEIANRMGATHLYFGIESDSINELEKMAEAIDSEAFEKTFNNLSKEKNSSYLNLKEKALRKMGFKLSVLPNDILAIEYIRAIKSRQTPMEYRAIKRIGAKYKDKEICDIMSASAIREEFYKNNNIFSIPKEAIEIIKKEAETGKINDINTTNRFLHLYTVLTGPQSFEEAFDVPNGMGYFICDFAKNCKKSESFTENISTKAYTTARLKRAILYTLFNVKSMDKEPKYTVLLGANNKGKAILKKNKKTEKFTIITKPSDIKKLSKEDVEKYERAMKVDLFYEGMYFNSSEPNSALKYIPYVK